VINKNQKEEIKKEALHNRLIMKGFEGHGHRDLNPEPSDP
jgi:hypothetical protein